MTAGALGSLTLSNCTVAGRVRVGVGVTTNPGVVVRIVRSQCAAVTFGPAAATLEVVDSTLDAGAGDAVRGAGLHLSLVGSTVVGAVLAHTLEASSAILDGRVVVENRQVGCLRYSYAPRGSRVPRRYRCSPSPTADPGTRPVLRRDRPRLALVPRARPGLSRRDRRGWRGRRRDGRAPPPRPPAAGPRDDPAAGAVRARRARARGARTGRRRKELTMHGDFSRRTFDPADGYRAVLLQQGRVLLDAELNEQAEITAHHDEARTRDVVGRSGGPAPTTAEPGPFAVVGPSSGPATQWAFPQRAVVGAARHRRHVLRRRRARREPRRRRRPGGRWATSRSCRSSPSPGPSTRRCRNRTTTAATWSSSTSGSGRSPSTRTPRCWSPLSAAPTPPPGRRRSGRCGWPRSTPTCAAPTCTSGPRDHRGPRRMAAELAAPDPSADPCEISASGGYQRLENQLYRVQVHDDVPNPASGADGTFLWSRDNGCVVAGVDALELVDADEAVLTLDRLGRDDELSFEAGQLVELTSRDRELRGLPGFLAVTGPRTGFDLPVTWRGTAARLARRPRDGADRAPLGGRAGADHYRPDRPGGGRAGPLPGRRATADRRLLADPGADRPARLRARPGQRHDRVAADDRRRRRAAARGRPSTTSPRWRSSSGPAASGRPAPTAGCCSRP